MGQAGTAMGTVAMLMLIAHVSAGCIAILAGAAALSARKGERLHRRVGTIFFASMLVMGVFATVLSVLRQPGTIAGGIFVCYLVATAWATVRRKEGSIGSFEKMALVVAVACAVAELLLGLQATRSPTGRFLGYPAPLYYVLGFIVSLAAAGDLKLILRGGISGTARIVRHLWRMCFALFFATGSFFLGQQKVMPAFMHGSSVLLVLGIAPLAVMVYWLIRVRASRAGSKPGAAVA